jgi:hypothetical protein
VVGGGAHLTALGKTLERDRHRGEGVDAVDFVIGEQVSRADRHARVPQRRSSATAHSQFGTTLLSSSGSRRTPFT